MFLLTRLPKSWIYLGPTKILLTWSILASFRKTETCCQTVLPDNNWWKMPELQMRHLE